jgi:DNA-binding NtrC family response regulator/CHASE2 domain-containing sensor protein
VRTVASALAIGLAASLAAVGAWGLGGASLTALEWAAYDRWLRERAIIPVTPNLVVIVRDRASEAQLGSDTWDRTVHARLTTELARAGAVAIGLDISVAHRSPPARGGASSDLMLSHATALAGTVVYAVPLEPAAGSDAAATTAVHHSWPAAPTMASLIETRPTASVVPTLLERARGAGHTIVSVDPDGVVRRVPLFVRSGERVVPAFGLVLAAAGLRVPPQAMSLQRGAVGLGPASIPVDARGQMLVVFAGRRPGLRAVGFSDVWTAIQEGQAERLQELVDDRIVLAITEPGATARHTPGGRLMSDFLIQAHLADSLLGHRWLREVPIAWTGLGSLILASVTAGLVLAIRGWTGLLTAGCVAVAYASAVVFASPIAGLVLPVGIPLSAVTVAVIAALLWAQLGAAYRVRHLEDAVARVEGELTTARDALVRQESTVESLEDDLDAARAAAARSADAEAERLRATDVLRTQLGEARREEEETRRRLLQLERELRGLRTVESRPGRAGDPEHERLARACVEMGIVTRDPAVLAVFRDLEKAARASLPILLLGEPGTGKELFARAAHRLSARADKPFVAVNMAAISPELFESEMFGHVRGAFTGSVGDRRGFFELADRGTIFLDEIGELRPEHQSKLLRVLQEKSFYRVGGHRPTAVDVRVVAASNRDLDRGVAEGWFREDLYFRLKGIVLRLPPLRERLSDLPLLVERFVQEAARDVRRPGLALSEEALAALAAQEWKGNVRELQHCVTQGVALAEGDVVTATDLRLAAREPERVAVVAGVDAASDAAVLACLRKHRFDMQAAAAALGWDRSTVTQRLKGLGFRALLDASGDRAAAARALAGDPALERVVELKLREYHEHLLRAVEGFTTAEAAIAACRRRFKNLPERHFRSLESLVRQAYEDGGRSWR